MSVSSVSASAASPVSGPASPPVSMISISTSSLLHYSPHCLLPLHLSPHVSFFSPQFLYLSLHLSALSVSFSHPVFAPQLLSYEHSQHVVSPSNDHQYAAEHHQQSEMLHKFHKLP